MVTEPTFVVMTDSRANLRSDRPARVSISSIGSQPDASAPKLEPPIRPICWRSPSKFDPLPSAAVASITAYWPLPLMEPANCWTIEVKGVASAAIDEWLR